MSTVSFDMGNRPVVVETVKFHNGYRVLAPPLHGCCFSHGGRDFSPLGDGVSLWCTVLTSVLVAVTLTGEALLYGGRRSSLWCTVLTSVVILTGDGLNRG